jgi:hypothetical protein
MKIKDQLLEKGERVVGLSEVARIARARLGQAGRRNTRVSPQTLIHAPKRLAETFELDGVLP